jgi:hypothetical protein
LTETIQAPSPTSMLPVEWPDGIAKARLRAATNASDETVHPQETTHPPHPKPPRPPLHSLLLPSPSRAGPCAPTSRPRAAGTGNGGDNAAVGSRRHVPTKVLLEKGARHRLFHDLQELWVVVRRNDQRRQQHLAARRRDEIGNVEVAQRLYYHDSVSPPRKHRRRTRPARRR